MFYRIYEEALIKSILFKTVYEDDPNQYPTLSEMADKKATSKYRVPLITVSNNYYNCTSHYNPDLSATQ